MPQSTQAVIEVDPVFGLNFPATQAKQLAAAANSLYLPAGQSAQPVPAAFQALPGTQVGQDAVETQKSPLFVVAIAEAIVAPAESFTVQECSVLQQVPALACPL